MLNYKIKVSREVRRSRWLSDASDGSIRRRREARVWVVGVDLAYGDTLTALTAVRIRFGVLECIFDV